MSTASEQAALRRAQHLLAERDRKGRRGGVGTALKEGSAPGGERARLTAWVHGVVRHRRTLHTVLGGVAKRAMKGRDPLHEAALELGAWRLLFGRDPAAAVIDEVEALVPGRKDKEHVRRVLEALSTAVVEVVHGEAEALLEQAGDAFLPLTRTTAARFKKPILGVSGRNVAGRLGIFYSLPDALVAGWLERHGEAVTRELCRVQNEPPPLFARVQPLRTTRDAALAALAAQGVEAAAAPLEHALVLLGSGRGAFRRSDPWRAGQLSIQDLTAQRAAFMLAPRPGERLLDLCAAPGTKTTALAEHSLDQATILACDRSPQRIRKVEQNAQRLGLTSIRTRVHDARRPGELVDEGPFDAVLVDAPCSNTGVLRRRPEARWRYDRGSQGRLVRDQEAILDTAAALVRPGGRLVYSVCSIEPEEGEALVRRQAGLVLEREELVLPTIDGGDGGYLALLMRPV